MNAIYCLLVYAIVSGGVAIATHHPLQAKPHSASAISHPSLPQEEIDTQFYQHFMELGVEGSILIYDLKQDRTYQHNPERNHTPYLPASTFKIINSLIALETGIIESDISILTWDGIERDFDVWNRDLNMREAFKISAVWFYQVLARRIGHTAMQDWVTRTGYGNQTIGGVADIDTFWLNGELRITPEEQIQFLQQLYSNDLPFSQETMATVKDIMVVEQTPDYKIRAKTGWALAANVGWYVGYVEQNENIYFFATNITIQNDANLAARQEITRRCLRTLGLL